jgi:hypothetical protein
MVDWGRDGSGGGVFFQSFSFLARARSLSPSCVCVSEVGYMWCMMWYVSTKKSSTGTIAPLQHTHTFFTGSAIAPPFRPFYYYYGDDGERHDLLSYRAAQVSSPCSWASFRLSSDAVHAIWHLYLTWIALF